MAELQAELTALKAARTAAITGKASASIDGMSYSNWRLAELRTEIVRCEKSIQRLLRGGRGMPVDMSIGQPDTGATAFDPLTGEALYG